MKPTLTDAANTDVPAYLTLLKRGLAVSRPVAPETDRAGFWVAEDEVRRYVAENLVTLLGLVTMHETRGPEWTATDEEIDRFLAEFDSP